MRSDEPVPGFSSASPWPTLDLEWGRKLYPTAAPRTASGLMFGLPPTAADLNQPRGPMTSLKEEPLGARAWMQPVVDQTKYVFNKKYKLEMYYIFLNAGENITV